ncbi:MAG: HEAT repeat domain-containing protein [Planctomycetaceae bacterium]|nr:HEAT repeat domain-containing protein [Planctomycetaceae bacterium]
MTVALAFLVIGLGSSADSSPTDHLNVLCTQVEEESINGIPLSWLAASLGKKEFRHQRLEAMRTIALWAKSPQPYIPAYVEALQDPDENVRMSAAQNLGHLGQRIPSLTRDFLKELSKALEDSQQRVRAAAAYALSEIGSVARAELPALRTCFEKDQSADVRELALVAIVSVTAGSDDHLPALLMAVQREKSPYYPGWLDTLGRVGNKSPEAMTALHKALQSNDKSLDGGFSGIRQTAAMRLGHMGELARAAVPDLLKIIDEPIAYRDVVVPSSPGDPGPPRVVAQEPTNIRLRLLAAWAISRIEPASVGKAFDLVTTQLADANADMRLSSAIIVSRLAYLPESQRTSVAIKRLQDDPDSGVRTIARLAALRLVDSQFQGRDESYLSSLPLPKDGETTPDSAQMRATLEAKLKKLQSLDDEQDVEALMRAVVLPTIFERAVIQGNWKTQIARKGDRKWASLKKVFAQVQLDKIELTNRLAVVPSAATSRPLRFYWFAGDWYLSE